MLIIARYYDAWSDDYDYLLVAICAIDLSIFNDMICNVIMHLNIKIKWPCKIILKCNVHTQKMKKKMNNWWANFLTTSLQVWINHDGCAVVISLFASQC